jgi:hypothetical protein
MPTVMNLSAGDHGIDCPAEGCAVEYVWGSHPPLVELIASIESDPKLRGLPSRGSTATTLAIRMDAQVAMELYRRIALLAHSMGWQLPPTT